jgi:hypothetical protein
MEETLRTLDGGTQKFSAPFTFIVFQVCTFVWEDFNERWKILGFYDISCHTMYGLFINTSYLD